MQLKFLYALCLFLGLSIFASPNECAWHCHKAAAAATAAPPVQPSTVLEEEPDNSATPFMKLLYI